LREIGILPDVDVDDVGGTEDELGRGTWRKRVRACRCIGRVRGSARLWVRRGGARGRSRDVLSGDISTEASGRGEP